ncbi:membrane protein [Fulvitalea axinellae]|uniref:Membrane protein n=1 Tax=Fulvitalea axinellae TaxID=1182444 RepID=A0AAU9D4H0_9BACT|nr:membrane protein [Fulvitalea axinellae]
MSTLFKTLIVGVGATVVMDVFTFLLNLIGIKTLDYRLLGRWVGHMFKGRFSHQTIVDSLPLPYEQLIGWFTHYAIGISFSFLLVAVVGDKWLESPSPLPALVFGIVTIVAPFFLMQPAFGFGLAASNLPDPGKVRMLSFVIHAVFGMGLYLSAFLLALRTR